MITFGKETSGDLLIRITPDSVSEIQDVLDSAALPQCHTIYLLKRYIKDTYPDQILASRNRTMEPTMGKEDENA